MKNVKHSKASCEHGSPKRAVELGRYALGRFDLDPSSSEYWNAHIVRATRYFDRFTDFRKQQLEGRVWWNAAGADDTYKTDSLVRESWEALIAAWLSHAVPSAIWYGYNTEQLQSLQTTACGFHPSRFLTLLFRERQNHWTRPKGGGPPIEGKSPTHSNYMCILPDRRSAVVRGAQLERFWHRGRELGQIVRPM